MKIWFYVCLIFLCVGCGTANIEEGAPMQESRPAKLLFMSPAHVMEMNLLLAESAEVRAESAKLDRRYVLAFKLEQGDKTHWWQTIFDPREGMWFSLQPPEETPDLTLAGDYVEYITFMKRMAAGEVTPDQQPVTATGDENLMEKIGGAFAAGQKAATIGAEFPEL